MEIPKKLYKYRSFNVNTLRLLGKDRVYYAQPSSFNDPLDCQPTIKADLSISEMERLLEAMLIKDGTAGDIAILRLKSEADEFELRENRSGTQFYADSLERWIRDQLLSQFDSLGVLSLGSTWDSVLMWSHYSDSHKGICIEFDVAENECDQLRQVSYSRHRQISMRDILRWQEEKSKEAEERIRSKFFAAKAPSWKYEKEWRDIRMASGEASSPFVISGVYFGLKCDPAVVSTIAGLFSHVSVDMYRIYTQDGTFRLHRRALADRPIEHARVRNPAFASPFDDDDIPF